MSNNLKCMKNEVTDYLKVSFFSALSVPPIVLALYVFDINKELIVLISFLFSVAVIEYFYSTKHRKIKKASQKLDFPSNINLGLFIKQPDLCTNGAITPLSDRHDVKSSKEIREKAQEIYRWSKS